MNRKNDPTQTYWRCPPRALEAKYLEIARLEAYLRGRNVQWPNARVAARARIEYMKGTRA